VLQGRVKDQLELIKYYVEHGVDIDVKGKVKMADKYTSLCSLSLSLSLSLNRPSISFKLIVLCFLLTVFITMWNSIICVTVCMHMLDACFFIYIISFCDTYSMVQNGRTVLMIASHIDSDEVGGMSMVKGLVELGANPEIVLQVRICT